MYKLITIILLFVSGSLVAQQGPGNDTTKYLWSKFVYGNRQDRYQADKVMGIPMDTGYSKSGLARLGNALYLGDGVSWTNVTGSGSGGSTRPVFGSGCIYAVNDSTLALDTTCAATRYYVDSVVRISNPGRSDSYIIEGSIYHVDSLHFRSTVFKYVLDGVYIEAPITDIFLSPADLVLNRTDVFYLASDSTVKTRVGTLVAGILEPPLLAGQLRAAAYTVLAGATTPANVSHIDIYREGAGPEWSHTAVGLSPTWQYATNPYPGGLYSINSNAFTTNNYIYFQGTPVDAAAITYLTMDVRNSHPYAGALNVRLHNSSANTDFVSLGLSNGYDKNKAGEWMNVVIPAYKIPRLFTLGSVNLFWLNFNGNDNNIQFDNIRLQLGGANSGTPVVVVPPVPTTTNLSPNRKLYLRKDQYGNAMPGMTDSTLVTTVLVDTSMTKSTSTDTVQIGLKPTGVVAGPYTNANLIVGADGRILGVSNGTASTGSGKVYAGSGLEKVNDSTLRLADSVRTGIYSGLAERVKYTDTAAMEAPNFNDVSTPNDSTLRIYRRSGGFKDVVITGSGNSGTVTNFTSGNASPLFTTSVTNPTGSVSQTFALTNPGTKRLFGTDAGTPTYLTSIDSTWVPDLHSQNYYDNRYTQAAGSSKWTQTGNTLYPNLSYVKIGINNTSPASSFQVNINGIAASVNDSISIINKNNTAAISGTQQPSGGYRWDGNAFGTTAGTSQLITHRMRQVLTQGTTPTGNLILERQINGGGYLTLATFSNVGALTVPSDMIAANFTTAGQLQANTIQLNVASAAVSAFALGVNQGSVANSTTTARWSPYLRWLSSAWNTTTLAANSVEFGAEVRSLAGNPVTGNWVLWSNTNAGGITPLMQVSNIGWYNLTPDYFTPATGATVVSNKTMNIINPAGTLATLTVTLPASPANGDIVEYSFSQAVTVLTFNGGTLANSVTTTSAGGHVKFQYSSTSTLWHTF